MKAKIVLFFFTIFALFFTSAAGSQTVDYDGLRFSSVPDLPSKNYSGYSVLRVLITNGSSRERKIKLFMRADYSRNIEEVSRSFIIAAGEVREESLYFPIADFSTPGLLVEVDGNLLADRQLKQYFRSYRNFYNKKQALVDSKIARTDFEKLFVATGTSTPVGKFDFEMNQFDGSLSQLYRTWLGYSQFHMLLYQSDSIEAMPEAISRAVFDYVRAGGFLLIIGKTKLPEDFVEFHKAESSATDLRIYAGGFGRVYFAGSDFFDKADINEINTLRDLLAEPFSAAPLPYQSSVAFAQSEIETVSAMWLMLLVFFFAFLIGPVNVTVLHRMGKKIWVFFTVPIASFLCCMLIFGYYHIFESSILKVKEQSLTLLDERFNRAITLADYGIFSSSSRSEGLKYEADTEVFPIYKDDYRSSDAGKSIVLDELQHFAGGWIKPRLPAYMHLRMIQTRRERINLVVTGDHAEVLNGLGTDIDEIYLQTATGKYFTGRNIPAGSRGELKSIAFGQNFNLVTPAEALQKGWFNSVKDMVNSPGSFLLPGQYLVRAKKSPFLHQALDQNADKQSNTYILGIMKVEAQQ